jgi:hypothetical protein
MVYQTDRVLKAFEYVKAYLFFPKYCPGITNWKNKMAGKNGRGNPLGFTDAEKGKIRRGLKQLAKDTQTKPRLTYYRGRLDATRGINAGVIVMKFK